MEKRLYILKLNTLEIHRCVSLFPVRSFCGKVVSDKTRKWKVLETKELENILIKEPKRHLCKFCNISEEAQ